MASINLYFPKLLKWEGGFVNDPVDRGGATNMGVTLSTWKTMGYDKNNDGIINELDIKLLTHEDAKKVCKAGYWDKWQADKINNQSIAEQLVEWVWGSGKWGIIIPQRLLGVVPDGKVGPKTLQAVNSVIPEIFHKVLVEERIKFVNNIVEKDPSQKRFIKGWTNRILAFKFEL